MAQDDDLQRAALEVKIRAGHDYLWVHQTSWMGEPCLQLPTDILALSDIIFRTNPDYIIESGVAWGGTTLFLASCLDLIGGACVLGVDIFIPEDLRTRIFARRRLAERIKLIEGSSLDPSTFKKIKEVVQDSAKVMVLLDSNHTHEHVYEELKIYAPMVGVGQYLIVGDTTIERQPPAANRPRPWGKGNNPATALKQFLAEDRDEKFQVDTELEGRLLFTNNPGGYLRRMS